MEKEITIKHKTELKGELKNMYFDGNDKLHVETTENTYVFDKEQSTELINFLYPPK